jgi:hypothetical protein
MIVLSEPNVDRGLGLSDGVEPLCVQDFAAKSSIEALVISVLHGDPG